MKWGSGRLRASHQGVLVILTAGSALFTGTISIALLYRDGNVEMTRKGSTTAINWIRQNEVHRHHPVIVSMMRSVVPLPVEPNHIIELSGLRVPREYDCGTIFSRTNKGVGSFDYSYSVPSRIYECARLKFHLDAGLLMIMPEPPLIDQEYLEAVHVYQMALNAKNQFNLVELGARWGTWGFRSLAALRQFNPHFSQLQINMLLVEPEQASCEAMENMVRVNGFSAVSGIKRVCGYANAQSFREWAESLPWIDVLNIDIQGAEYDFIPAVFDVINAKVKRVVIGLHREGPALQIVDLFRDWKVSEYSTYAGSDHCREIYFGRYGKLPRYEVAEYFNNRTTHELNKICDYPLEQTGEYGEVVNWDGEFAASNPRFRVRGLD